MIRVVITGPASSSGFFPYRIDWFQQGRPQFVGLSREPLLDACRQLHQMGIMSDTVVGLFDEWEYRDEWRLRTTVGYGAGRTVEEGRAGFRKYVQRPPDAPQHGVRRAHATSGIAPNESEATMMGKYREFPGGPILDAGIPSDQPSTPPAAPPEPRRSPTPPADKGPGHAKPKKSGHSHPKRKQAKSGGRQGRR